MIATRGTYRNGCITPEAALDWPDGMRVLLEPEPPALAWERTTGEEWPEDREAPTWHWTATLGTYRGGRVCPDERVDWPDGTRVDLEAKPEAGKNGSGALRRMRGESVIALKGTVKNGQVVLDEPAGLPEGTRVEVVPVEARPAPPADEEAPMTEEEIQAVLDAMSRIEPLLMTAEEEARWKADLRAQREYDLANAEAHAEKLRRMWE